MDHSLRRVGLRRADAAMDGFVSKTGSSRGMYKRNGEWIAIAHEVPTKSYNQPQGGKGNESTMKATHKDPNVKAALSKYHPNAPRNRLPVHFTGAAIPHVRFCQKRNEHTYECARAHPNTSPQLRTRGIDVGIPRRS